MQANIVLTLTGKDRIGIVEEVTKLPRSRRQRGDQSHGSPGWRVCILMLVSLPAKQLARLEKDVEQLTAHGYKVTTSQTERTYAETHPGWLPFQIEVHGADHEGIVHEIVHYLSQCGINIESMDTGTTQAPVSGTPLFTMTALVVVPPNLPGQDWEAKLIDVGHRLNVDVRVSAAKKQ